MFKSINQPTRRSRRKIHPTTTHDRKYELLKALEADFNRAKIIKETTEQPINSKQINNAPTKEKPRWRRDDDENQNEFKSLQQILDEFKNTRDAIQEDFEWKYYNISSWESSTINPAPTLDTYEFSNNKTDGSIELLSTKCSCHLEIILAMTSVGAMFLFAYALRKFVIFIRREK